MLADWPTGGPGERTATRQPDNGSLAAWQLAGRLAGRPVDSDVDVDVEIDVECNPLLWIRQLCLQVAT